jgi:DNA repair exonuclease SbcCD ATPase subunit
MYLSYTEHYKFKRFKLNPISHFIYEPQNPLTFVIGTNGSGKSSLLEQWDPMPKSSSDYEPGGYCKQRFTDADGNEYELSSYFDKNGGAKHHFVKNGEPLNNGETGGTAKVQRQLVETHLQFDKELHKVLSGDTSFSKMTPSMRQKVITEISNCDLSYAMEIHQKLAQNARQAKATKKDLRLSISEDKDKLPAYNIQQVEAKQKEIKETLRHLSAQMLDSAKNNVEEEKQQFEQLERNIVSHIERHIQDDNNQIDTLGHRSYESLLESHSETNKRIDEIGYQIESKTQLAYDNQKALDRLKASVSTSGESAKEAIARIEKELSNLGEVDESLANEDLTAYRVAESKLNHWLAQHFGINPLPETAESYDKITTWLKKYPDTLKAMEQDLSRVTRWLEHAQNHEAMVDCPQCEHRFTPGINLSEKADYEKRKAHLEERIDAFVKAKAGADERVENYAQEQHRHQTLTEALGDYPPIRKLLDAVFSNELSVNEVLSSLNRTVVAIETQRNRLAERDRLNKELYHHQAMHSQYGEGGIEKEIAVLTQNVEESKAQLENLQDELILRQKERDALDAIKRRYDYEEKLKERVHVSMEKLQGLANDIVRSECNRFIEQIMDGFHEDLARQQSIINEYKSLKDSIARLESIEQNAAEREEDFEFLAKVLSPNTGIIADQLKEHIHVLVTHMNQIIGQIWEHNLEVLPCGIDNGKLDYYFPVYVDDDPEPVPDVGKCSKGQREVIDLAFNIVLMLQRDLTEYPLYLDEVASSFDKAHRFNFMQYLDVLFNGKKISQIFMINHYSDMYGLVGDHDVVVIDKTNVLVPESYNQSVIIK